jgi:hypothetical protein
MFSRAAMLRRKPEKSSEMVHQRISKAYADATGRGVRMCNPLGL